VRVGWRLGVTLSLFASAAGVLHFVPPVRGAVQPVSLYALPTTLGAWTGADGAPEEALPSDPNEKVSVRRSYHSGNHLAWVSVALFVAQNDETRRASVNKIYPQRGVSLIQPLPLTVVLNGPSASPIALPVVVVHQGSQRLVVVYWHQIGNQVYGNEYRFRLALMRDIIFARRADALLVRIATSVDSQSQVADGLDALARLAPPLYAEVAREMGR
jgi:EpsI family protein